MHLPTETSEEISLLSVSNRKWELCLKFSVETWTQI